MKERVPSFKETTIRAYRRSLFGKKLKIYMIGLTRPDILPYQEGIVEATEQTMLKQMENYVSAFPNPKTRRGQKYALFLETRGELTITEEEQKRMPFPKHRIGINNIDLYTLREYKRILEQIRKMRSVIAYDNQEIVGRCKVIEGIQK